MNYLGPSLRRKPRRNRPWLKAVVALAASLLANAALLLLVPTGGIMGALKPGAQRRDVVLAPLSRSEWEANRGVASPHGPTASRPAPIVPPVVVPTPPPPPPTHAPGQVVDIGPSKNQTPPKDSRFVAEHDSTVEKETRSRHSGRGYQNTLPTPSDPGAKGRPDEAAVQGPPQVAVAGAAAREGKPGAPGQPRPAAPAARPAPAPRPAGQDPRLALRTDALGELRTGPGARSGGQPDPFSPPPAPAPAGQPPGSPGAGGEDGGGGRALSAWQLRPSAAQYDRLAGGPGSDKLEGVEEGEGTFLNARSWKYAGYFNRMKRQLQSEWDPTRSLQARDPGGSRFGDREWVTMVHVRLDDRGGLKEIQVTRKSGLEFLDRLAIEAFQRAAPFVNPPKGLAVDGEIAFDFGFHVEVGTGTGLAGMFRAPPPTGD